tara:strand:- start:1711 stop:2580 length:870 start_codon:yes stop_codon:yes gene_type:complete
MEEEENSNIIEGLKDNTKPPGITRDTEDATIAPYGYSPLVKNDAGTYVAVEIYLNALNPNGQWYYQGDEDSIIENLSVQQLRTLQDRLVRTSWFSAEDYSKEYGRKGRATRDALKNALYASNFERGVGYETAIDLEILNPGEVQYVPKTYQATDKTSRLKKVDAIFKSLGLQPTNKEKNYYELILKDLEEKEFYNDETVDRISVEGPKVTKTETRRQGVEPLSEKPTEIVEVEETVEKIPDDFDALSRLQERVGTDFAGVLARQGDVTRARINTGNIAQSIMRLKGLGG